MCGLKLPKMMEIVVLIGNFNRVKLNRLRNGGSVFSKKPKLGSVIEVRNPNLDSCIGEHYAECFSPGNGRSNSQTCWRPCRWSGPLAILRVIIILPSDLVLVNVLSVTLEIRPRTLLKRVFKSLVMFYLISVSLLSHDQSLKCELSLKFPSHVNMGVLSQPRNVSNENILFGVIVFHRS